jgi:hypothetical protein
LIAVVPLSTSIVKVTTNLTNKRINQSTNIPDGVPLIKTNVPGVELPAIPISKSRKSSWDNEN